MADTGPNSRLNTLVLVDDSSAVGSVTWGDGTQHEFLSESMTHTSELLLSESIIGSRATPGDTVREGVQTISGTLEFDATQRLLYFFMEMALGGSPSAAIGADGTIVPASTVPEFAVLIDRQTDTFGYAQLKCNSITINGQAGGMVRISVDCVGLSANTGVSFPTLAPVWDDGNVLDVPFVMTDSTLTLPTATLEISSFSINYSNNLDPIRNNTQLPTHILEGDATCSLSFNSPYTANSMTDLGDNSAAPITTSLLDLTHSTNYVSRFAFADLYSGKNQPTTAGRGEIRWDHTLTSTLAASDDDLLTYSNMVA